MYDLGSRLKQLRQKRGITQKDLALRINKSISAISSYESNAQLPPLDVIRDIALVLHVSLDHLVGIDKTYTLSTKAMMADQREILDLLLQEFCSGNDSNEHLTQEQILLLQKLIHYFMYKKEG